ncbi:MAG TPA: hypothetical protein VF493_23275 [Terriglobales bacterium]
MRHSRILITALGLLVMFMFLLPQASADQWDRKTIVTFSAPVEVPGVDPQVLPAGKYVFKLFNSMSDRNIVQIFNENEDQVYTTILAIPNYRLKATDESVISFEERPAGKPQALKAWFYPGMKFGQQFVYPKQRAMELAKEVKEPILETPTTTPKTDLNELSKVPVEAVEPSGQIVEMTKVVEPPPVTEAVQVAQAEPARELPKTASWLPLLGLAGIVSLGASLGLKILRRLI